MRILQALTLLSAASASNIYTFNLPNHGSERTSIPLTQVSLAVAHYLGIDNSQELRTQDVKFLEQIITDSMWNDHKRPILVHIDGLEGRVSSKTPSYTASEDGTSIRQMLTDLVTASGVEHGEKLESKNIGLYGKCLTSLHTEMPVPSLPVTTRLSPTKQIDRSFLQEVAYIKGLLTTSFVPQTFNLCSFSALDAVLHEYGKASAEFMEAQTILRDTLQRLCSSVGHPIVLVTSPSSSESPDASRGGSLARRNEGIRITQQAGQPKPSLLPMSSCFASEDACMSNTKNCTMRGSCKQDRGSQCWSCACRATKENKKTTRWAGASCEKKDLSTEFHLFLWTGIVFIGLVAWAISLLYGASQVDMGNVLGATGYVKRTS